LAKANEKNNKNPFFERITRGLVESDISLSKLDNGAFRMLLEEISGGKIIPSRTTARRYVKEIYEETIERIEEKIDDNPIYLIVDETSDKCSNYVLNILVGILNGKFEKPMLIKTKFIEDTKGNTIFQSINDVMKMLVSENEYDRLWLIISDQVPNIFASNNQLKS